MKYKNAEGSTCANACTTGDTVRLPSCGFHDARKGASWKAAKGIKGRRLCGSEGASQDVFFPSTRNVKSSYLAGFVSHLYDNKHKTNLLECSLKLTECSLKLTIQCSLKLTIQCSLKLTIQCCNYERLRGELTSSKAGCLASQSKSVICLYVCERVGGWMGGWIRAESRTGHPVLGILPPRSRAKLHQSAPPDSEWRCTTMCSKC
jgi:hypothetical protein